MSPPTMSPPTMSPPTVSMPTTSGGRPGRRRSVWGATAGVAALFALGACTSAGESASPASTSPTTAASARANAPSTAAPVENLFAVGATAEPTLIRGAEPPVTSGERVVPGFCRPLEAGLSHRNDGFLLVVKMESEIPSLDQAPGLPNGVLLNFLEFNVGVFAPSIAADHGGSFKYIRQYQRPDRPALEVANLGAGRADSVDRPPVDIRGREIRVQLPGVGPNTGRVTQWGVSVTCALRHPVDGFYFPSTRFPAETFSRAPTSGAL